MQTPVPWGGAAPGRPRGPQQRVPRRAEGHMWMASRPASFTGAGETVRNWFPFVTQVTSYLGGFGPVTQVLEPRPPRLRCRQHPRRRTALGVRPSASSSTGPPPMALRRLLGSAVPGTRACGRGHVRSAGRAPGPECLWQKPGRRSCHHCPSQPGPHRASRGPLTPQAVTSLPPSSVFAPGRALTRAGPRAGVRRGRFQCFPKVKKPHVG